MVPFQGLCDNIALLHDRSVCLHIEDMGIKSLVKGEESPAILFMTYLQGAFAHLSYWDRRGNVNGWALKGPGS